MPVTTDPADRARGLVWTEPALAVQPATHVLVAGIGRFDARAGPPPVSSPPASARRVAQWFLDGAAGRGPGFANPARPLGSLALLLSETPDGTPSQAEGGPVPRASFASMQAAVKDLILRAESNPANTLVLFIASHGIAVDRRSAILFEDYGTDPFNTQAGMTETGQLAAALGQVRAAGKLVIFDCCRNEGESLDPAQPFGLPLVGHMGRPELPRRPQVMRSTLPGRKAFGRPDGPTLFTEALLAALGGLAANPGEQWRVGSTRLAEVTNKLLGLNEADGEDIQVADFELTAEFPVTVAPRSDRVALFLSVEPPASEDDWEIEVVDPAGAVLRSGPAVVGARHARFDLPARRHAIRLRDPDGQLIVETEAEPLPPIAFQSIPDPFAVLTQRTKSVDAAATGPAIVQVNAEETDGAVARIERLPGPRPVPPPAAGPAPAASDEALPAPAGAGEGRSPDGDFRDLLNAPFGGPAAIQRARTNWMVNVEGGGGSARVAPGRARVRIDRRDGSRYVVEMDLRPGETVALGLPGIDSRHEWMAEAVAAGVVPAATPRLDPADGPPLPVRVASAGEVRLAAGGPAVPVRPADPDLHVAPGPGNLRFRRYDIDDRMPIRYEPQRPVADPGAAPPWVIADGPGWREAAFLPTLGGAGRWMQDSQGREDRWQAIVLADTAPGARAHLIPCATSRQWGSLLAFLGRRDFPNSGAALEALLGENMVEMAVSGKVQNPLAATAGVLTAVACGPIADSGLDPQWLRNLADWFPGLPDGAVALGRHLLREGQPDAARDAFRTAAARGIPVFSLAVDWLAEGLEVLAPDAAEEPRRWAWRTDPARAFTVLKLGA
jgi:hypothetical protein